MNKVQTDVIKKLIQDKIKNATYHAAKVAYHHDRDLVIRVEIEELRALLEKKDGAQ